MSELDMVLYTITAKKINSMVFWDFDTSADLK